MRDIVSETGTFFTGLAGLPTVSSTQTPTVVGQGVVALAGYDGAMIYILTTSLSSAGTMTPVVQVTNDNGSGSPNGSNWTNAPVADLITWQATSGTNFLPVKATDANGLPTGNVQPTALSTTLGINQRVGYIGTSFVSGSSTLQAQYLRVVSTVASSWSAAYDVIILLGRPRIMPANV